MLNYGFKACAPTPLRQRNRDVINGTSLRSTLVLLVIEFSIFIYWSQLVRLVMIFTKDEVHGRKSSYGIFWGRFLVSWNLRQCRICSIGARTFHLKGLSKQWVVLTSYVSDRVSPLI